MTKQSLTMKRSDFLKMFREKNTRNKVHIHFKISFKKMRVTYLLGHSEQEVSISVLPCPHEPWFSRSRSGSELHGGVSTGVS